MSGVPWFLAGSARDAGSQIAAEWPALRLPSGTLRLYHVLEQRVLAEFPNFGQTLDVWAYGEGGRLPDRPDALAETEHDEFQSRLGAMVDGSPPRSRLLAQRAANVGALVFARPDRSVVDVHSWELDESVALGSTGVWVLDEQAQRDYEALAQSSADIGRLRIMMLRKGCHQIDHDVFAAPVLHLDPLTRDGHLRVWRGIDDEGELTHVGLDLAYDRSPVRFTPVDDPWLVAVFGGGARLSDDADVARLVSRARPFWVGPYFPPTHISLTEHDLAKYTEEGAVEGYVEAPLYHLPDDVTVQLIGHLPLEGNLLLGDRSTMSEIETGIVVEPGLYPVFLSGEPEYGPYAFLIRLDAGRPVRWSFAPWTVDGAVTQLPMGEVLFWSGEPDWDAFREQGSDSRPLRLIGGRSGAIHTERWGNFKNGVFEVYVGYDASDRPIAMILDAFNMVGSAQTQIE